MTTAYITHADCLRHDMGPGHPESPERLSAIHEHMRSSGLMEELRCLEAPLADTEALKRVHRASYVDLIFENAPSEGYVQLDPDTAMNPHSLTAARRAAGAGLLAVDEVMAGQAMNAFCAVRPCGHHATQVRSMGFCIFNNIGIAAAYALEQKGLERVAVIDFDVHHGNGTEDMFSAPAWQERVLMASFFPASLLSLQRYRQPRAEYDQCAAGRRHGGEGARKAVEQKWLRRWRNSGRR